MVDGRWGVLLTPKLFQPGEMMKGGEEGKQVTHSNICLSVSYY